MALRDPADLLQNGTNEGVGRKVTHHNKPRGQHGYPHATVL